LKNYLNKLKKTFEAHSVDVKINDNEINFSYSQHYLSIAFYTEKPNQKNKINLPFDYLVNQFDKIIFFIQSKLHLNKTIYARLCNIKRIDKPTATNFFNTYHFLNYAGAAFNYGLFYKGELMSVACFSKGRKMNRLNQEERGFELMRFCTRGGITITGGLSKLLQHFCAEKNPGDIMTYIDKQFSDGNSFINSGFKIHSLSTPNYFLIHKITFVRTPIKANDTFDENEFYKTLNSGNLKMVFTPKKLV
jgi:hypothetical protein